MSSLLRLIVIGERYFQSFQGLGIIGDMNQRTEAFCHVKFSRSKNINFVNIPIFIWKKNRNYGRLENMREKNVDNLEKSSPIRMTLKMRRASEASLFLLVLGF